MKNVYISTSDFNLPILRVSSFLFNKHWSKDQKVIVFGFKEPTFELPNNYSFISLGIQRGIRYWGLDQEKILEHIIEDKFLYMFEDELFIRPVQLDVIEDLEKVIESDDSIGRIDITPGPSLRSHTIFQQKQNYSLIKLTQNAEYKITLRASFWNKNYFQRFIGAGTTPIDFEVQGSNMALNHDEKILATKDKFATYIMDGIRRGNINNLDFRAKNKEVSSFGLPLLEEDIQELKDQNIIQENKEGFFKILI